MKKEATLPKDEASKKSGGLLQQPKSVWAVAFSCVVAFMGIGLVDPILPALANQLNASNSQVMLLFTSYFLITGLAMLITDMVSSRIGSKWTLLLGLLLIIIFAAAAGASTTINQIIAFRAGWGFGNALFIATALAVIVGSAKGDTDGAIILYEAALGIGIATGPLVGGLLGGISWRGPFIGVAVLMAIGFIAISAFLGPVKRESNDHRSLIAPLKALRHRGLLLMGIIALFYNFGFFTLLAFTPLVLDMNAHMLGLIFFGWGLLLAITSVFVAPRLHERFGIYPSMLAVLISIAAILLIMALGISSNVVVITAVIISGAFLGINNTLITTAVMKIAPVERPVASASYSFVRFFGGGIAPWLAGVLSGIYGNAMPYYVGMIGVLISIFVLYQSRGFLKYI